MRNRKFETSNETQAYATKRKESIKIDKMEQKVVQNHIHKSIACPGSAALSGSKLSTSVMLETRRDVFTLQIAREC
jgi:hypothetical protein